MKILEVNVVPYGSTGTIAKQITHTAKKRGHDAVFAYCWTKKKQNHVDDGEWIITSLISRGIHACFAKLFGGDGSYSSWNTKVFLKKVEEYKPDIIHLHVLHAFCCDLGALFEYIKKNNIRTVWTFHDCWPITGQCPHFISINCRKWMTECCDCPIQSRYSLFPVDSAKRMWHKKISWFSDVPNLTIVTPSFWLSEIVNRSFMKSYPVQVINNGIDLSIFHPTSSNFRERYGIEESKHLLLGVAFGWGERKGLDVFIELAKRLDSTYQIVLVGTDSKIDAQLPANIISIHRTQNRKELAEIYTAADLFVNPTREENYPTVNMESIACGTPVLTFRTGGSPEIVNENCGSVVDCDDVDALEREIVRISTEHPYSKTACLKRAECFDMNARFDEYIELFEQLAKDV